MYYEIEDMDTGDKVMIECSTHEEAERHLLAAGFDRIGSDCYAQLFEGHEVSAMPYMVHTHPPSSIPRWLELLKEKINK